MIHLMFPLGTIITSKKLRWDLVKTQDTLGKTMANPKPILKKYFLMTIRRIYRVIPRKCGAFRAYLSINDN
jgi:hypothetical protein